VALDIVKVVLAVRTSAATAAAAAAAAAAGQARVDVERHRRVEGRRGRKVRRRERGRHGPRACLDARRRTRGRMKGG